MSAIPTITVHDLHELRNQAEDHFLLDVREPHEHALCRIEGATLIPLAFVEARAHELPKGRKLVVHCKAGGRSAQAVAKLLDLGFEDVWNVAGGINEWSKAIDPEVPLY